MCQTNTAQSADGEILPSARTNEQELELIRKEPAPAAATSPAIPSRAAMAA